MPTSPSARRPLAGPQTATRGSTHRAVRFSWTRAFSHIAVFIAGHRSNGPRSATATVVTASSHSPPRSLARRSAVAGATTIEIGTTRQLQVPVRRVLRGIHQVGEHRLTAERLEGERRDEARGIRGERHSHPRTLAAQAADQIAGLVGGDAAADSHHD